MASSSGGFSGDGSNEAKLKWMYDGPKSDINREDYLLGKKIDRNFEIVSDVVIRDTAEERQKELFAGRATGINKPTPSSSNFKESVLETDIVRKEDPLVLLKLREEQKKRAMLENPLTQMKIKRVLKEAFKKEMGKRRKRHKSRTKDSDSDESPDSSERKSHHNHHDEHSQRSTLRREESRSHQDHGRYRRQHGSRSRRREEHPCHDRRRLESADSYRRVREDAERRDSTRAGTSHRSSGHEDKPERGEKKRMSADEMKARLEAMAVNAKWRDEHREENLRHATEELKREVEESEKHPRSAVGASLLRPMFNEAAAASSVEKRIQSSRMKLQRSHDYMEKSFVRK